MKSLKDPAQLMEEADGNPAWLKEALEAIWQRLPPPSPPAPPTTAQLPSWDPHHLAVLSLDPAKVPLSSTNRWHLAAWLKLLATQLIDGILDEGDSKGGMHSLYTLAPIDPSSGIRERRGER
jgi:hypothetical protein